MRPLEGDRYGQSTRAGSFGVEVSAAGVEVSVAGGAASVSTPFDAGGANGHVTSLGGGSLGGGALGVGLGCGSAAWRPPPQPVSGTIGPRDR